jgi:hypothetical protein
MMVMLTKFSSAWNGEFTKIIGDEDLDSLDDDEFEEKAKEVRASLMKKINEGVLPKLQQGVRVVFGKTGVRFFLFDPTEQGEYKGEISEALVTKDSDRVFTQDQDDQDELDKLQEDCYELRAPFKRIMASFKEKFSSGISLA